MLSRVDGQQYPTVAHFIADLKLISRGAEQYWEGEARGIPEISRAKALEDQTCEALARRVTPDLSKKCDAIHAKGGPAAPPPGNAHISLLRINGQQKSSQSPICRRTLVSQFFKTRCKPLERSQ